MYKKVMSLIMVFLLLVSNSIFVYGKKIYDIKEGGVTIMNDIEIDGTLNWQVTFNSLGDSGSLTVSGTSISLSASPSWDDMANGYTYPCEPDPNEPIVDGWVHKRCPVVGGYDEHYLPWHYEGTDSSTQAVSDGTYTVNMIAYGDGITTADLSTITQDTNADSCGEFCTASCPYACNNGCYHQLKFWEVLVDICYSDGNQCDEYTDPYAYMCNGVYAKIEFFDGGTSVSHANNPIESDGWPLEVTNPDTKAEYTAWDKTFITDNNPGSPGTGSEGVEVEEDITIELVCEDEGTCTVAASGCNSASQSWECVMQGDGCYDNVTTDCASCASCSAGSCTSFCLDCGLRVYNGTDILTIACAPETYYPLKIHNGTDVYSIVLVDLTDPSASNIKIQTATGPMAMRNLTT